MRQGWIVLVLGCGPSLGIRPEIVVCRENCPASTASGVEWQRVPRGSTEAKTLIVWNRGSVTLNVSSVALAGSNKTGEFTVLLGEAAGTKDACPEGSFSLRPGSENDEDAICTLIVSYTPKDAATDEETLLLLSNDPASPQKQVRLYSSDIGPHVVIEPATIDFGLVENRTGPVRARVVNKGVDPADVVALTIAGSTTEFCVAKDGDCAAELKIDETLKPEGFFEIDVGFARDPDGSASAQLVADVAEDGVDDGLAILAGPPIARCEEDMTGEPLRVTQVDGSPSLTPGGSVCRYEWTVEGPNGSINAEKFNKGEALEGEQGESCPVGQNTVERPCFIADTPGEYVFSLRVVDCRSNCALADVGESCSENADCCSFDCVDGTCSDSESESAVCADGGGCEIASEVTECPVRIIPDQSLYVTLSWDGEGDLDLYMARCGGADPGWATVDAVRYNNPTEDWCEPRATNGVECTQNADCVGLTGDGHTFDSCQQEEDQKEPSLICTDATDDPFLLIDVCDGFGPEAMAVDLPCSDTYVIGVDYFGCRCGCMGCDCDDNILVATVRVYVLGIELPGSPFVAALSKKDFWTVGRVVVPPSLECACFQTEPLIEEENPVPNRVLSQLPSPCEAAPYTCDPDPCAKE